MKEMMYRTVLACTALVVSCGGQTSPAGDAGLDGPPTDATKRDAVSSDAHFGKDGPQSPDSGDSSANEIPPPSADAAIHDAEYPYPCGADQAYVIYEFTNEPSKIGRCDGLQGACGPDPDCSCASSASAKWCQPLGCSTDGGLTLVCAIAPDP
jgi:hypothetical protein